MVSLLAAETPYTSPEQHRSIYWIEPEEATIGIEIVRQLESEQAFSPLEETARIFAIPHFERSTPEAQNALLKTLESSTAQNQFWLVTHQLQQVLPTIQSRCVIVPVPFHLLITQEDQSSEIAELFQKVTAASISDCISLAATYADRDQAITVIIQLLTWLTNQREFVPSARQLDLLQTAYQRLSQGTNVKLALESAFFGLSGHSNHLNSV